MIFIYVTLKSSLIELYGHLKLINEFSTDTLRHSKLGYYTSTLEVAISQLLSMDKNILLEQNFKHTIVNADTMIIQNLKSSIASEYPLNIIEEFDFLEAIPEITIQEVDNMEKLMLTKMM